MEEKNTIKSSKNIKLVVMYTNEIPSNIIIDENEPRIKYFNDDSIEYLLLLLIDDNINSVILCDSSSKKNKNKLFTETKRILLNVRNSTKNKNSNDIIYNVLL